MPKVQDSRSDPVAVPAARITAHLEIPLIIAVSRSGRRFASGWSVSRPLRLHAPGFLHHVFARGNDKACIFVDDDDCTSFLALLATTLERFAVICVAYCLLWNHYHLLLVPGEEPLSRLMQHLNSRYCQRFNRRHRRVGHVLQGRFGCRIVEDGEYARSALRYLALNPVEAGRARVPEEWRWSSYGAVLGNVPVPDFLSLAPVWSAFGTSDPEIGRARFMAFVRAGVEEVFPNPLLHGSERLAAVLAPVLEAHRANRDHVYAERFAARPPLSVLLEKCGDTRSIEDAVHAAFHRHGYTLAQLGRALSRDPSTICRWIKRAADRGSDLVSCVHVLYGGHTSGPGVKPRSSPREDTDARNQI